MKKSINIDLSLDPLYESSPRVRQLKPRLKLRTQFSLETQQSPRNELNFKSQITPTAQGNPSNFLKYVKQQSKQLKQIQFRRKTTPKKQEMWLTDLDTQEESLPEIRPFLEGRTIQNVLQRSYHNKKRISNILLKLQDEQNKMTQQHSSYPQRISRQNSFNPELQNIEIEQCIVEQSDKENIHITPIYASNHTNRRNSRNNPSNQFVPNQYLNMQSVKEKLMYDMLRVNTNFEVDPLRLQFFSLNRIIQKNRQIKTTRDKEVSEIVQKSEKFKNESAKEKRNLYNPNSMKFTFQEQESFRNQLNRSLDHRMNKNSQQKQHFIKLLAYLKNSQLEISMQVKDQLEHLRSILLQGRPLTLKDILLDKQLKIIRLIIQQLRIT